MKTYSYADFYVSANGNDSWSGKYPEPCKDGKDGPFATVTRARDAVRLIKNDAYRNIYVLIRGGEYILGEPVVFTASDSHYDSYKIVYAAYPGETPVFSSDVVIKDWRRADELPGRVFVADLPSLPNGKKRFYTLYEDARLLTRAHSSGFEPASSIPCGDGCFSADEIIFADRNTLHMPPEAMVQWDNPEDVEIFIQPNVGYVTNYLPIKSVDKQNNTITTALPATYPMGRIDKHQFAIGEGSFWIENAPCYLNAPGQWAVNTRTGKVYLIPFGDKPGHVTCPALTEYFLVDGLPQSSVVKGIVFEGLHFTRADRDSITEADIGLQHDWDMWNKANAMVRLRFAEECAVDGCRFYSSGSAGVRLDLHCQCNEISNNLIDYIGGTGILLCGYGPGRVNVNRCNKVTNNHIHHVGELYYHSCGIMVWQSSDNVVANNLLHHLPYDAIVLSGVRPSYFNATGHNRELEGTIRRDEVAKDAQYQQSGSREDIHVQWRRIAPYYHTRRNLIMDNEIFLSMQRMFDGNAIYLSDVGSGNVIRRNYIHHLNGIGMQQAIRTDAFIKDTMITENIVYNCTGGGINVKYFENHVINNIVADIRDIVYENSRGESKRMFIGYISLLEVYEMHRMPPNADLKVYGNIFYKTFPHNPYYRETMVDGKLHEIHLEDTLIDYNLYYDVNAPDKGRARLEYYQGRGADPHGIVADPLFIDIKKGDFRLREDSPALALGFKTIDMSAIGLTNTFVTAYNDIVSQQLGERYADFDTLEEMCERNSSEQLKLEILDNV